jgi:hippurate hydrolase
VTQLQGGDTFNVIPPSVFLCGTARSFTPEVRDLIERRMGEITAGIAGALGLRADFAYERGYPPTVNHEAETELAAEAAAEIVGADNVDRAPPPRTGAEDFAFMLERTPGSYILMGNGPADGDRLLHNPNYDFNDESLPVGASYWARLVERVLPRAAA